MVKHDFSLFHPRELLGTLFYQKESNFESKVEALLEVNVPRSLLKC